MIAQKSKRPYIFLIVMHIISARGEDNIFRIRKCCLENELILENTSECVQFDLLKLNNHIYQYENNSKVDFMDTTTEGSRPWWFPPNNKILSKKTNISLSEFPKKMGVIYGQGQPCDLFESVFLPLYMSQIDFFDDGSILVYQNKNDEYQNQSDRLYTLSEEIIFDPMSYCIDRLELRPSIIEEETKPTLDFSDTVDFIIMLCPCKKATCVLKCCLPGMIIDVERQEKGEVACIKSEIENWTPNYKKLESDPRDYFLLNHFPFCNSNEGLVIPNQIKVDGHTIYSNGSAHIDGETHLSQPLQFCGENFISSNGDNKKIYNHILRCYPKGGIKEQKLESRRTLYGILFAIGAIFLFVTLLVRGLLPTRCNINDKNLVSQTWSLFIGYVCMAISQLGLNSLPQNACVIMGFLIQYSFLAAFFWLNILCFDISWTFNELRIVHGISNSKAHKKFIYYSIYCWITPAIISTVTATIEFLPSVPDHLIKPHLKENCWFKNDSKAILVYFYGPIAVLLSINILLFLHTLYRIYQAQRDIQTVIKNTNLEKKRFFLYVKLLLLMGLPWIAELASWIIGGPNYYWYLTDIINLLRAVFIFAVLCCKRQILLDLKTKMGIKNRPNIRRRSIPRNSSTFFASTQCQDFPKCANSAVSSL